MTDKATMAAVLTDGFPGTVSELAMDELRRRRQQCDAAELELSYRRRLLHGHLDLLGAELERRDIGKDVGPITSLLDSSSDRATGQVSRSPSHQRLDVDLDLDGEAQISADLPDCSNDELRARGEAWVALERQLSEQRRTVLGKLDQIQDEIVRRYKAGAASIDQILPGST